MRQAYRRAWIASILIAALASAALAGRPRLASLLERRGLAAKSSWHLSKAERAFSWAVALGAGDEAYWQRLDCLQKLGRFSQVEGLFERFPWGEVADSKLRVRFLNTRGRNHFKRFAVGPAEAAQREALSTARKVGDPRLIGVSMIELARTLYHLKGRFEEAEELLGQALSTARHNGLESVEAGALRHLGALAWWFRNDRDGVLDDFYRPALGIYTRLDDRPAAATVLRNMALLLNSRFNAPGAQSRLEESRTLSLSIGDAAGLAESDAAQGLLLDHQGSPWEAERYLRRAVERAKTLGFDLLVHEASTALVDVAIDATPFQGGRLEELHRQAFGSPSDRSGPTTHGATLCKIWSLNHPRKAIPWCRRLRQETSIPDSRSYLGIILADAYRRTGDNASARRSLAAAERDDASGRFEWIHAAVSAALAVDSGGRGEQNAAIRRLLTADSFGEKALVSTRLWGKRNVWIEELLEGLLTSDPPRPAAALLLLGHMRRNPLVHRASLSEPLSIAEARARLVEDYPGDEALVSFVVTRTRSFAIVASAGGIRALDLEVAPRDFARKVSLCRDLVGKADQRTGPEGYAVCAALRDSLIGSLEQRGWLAGVRQLVLMPYGALHELPWAALPRLASADVRFLIEDYSLVLLPAHRLFSPRPEPRDSLRAKGPIDAPPKVTAFGYGQASQGLERLRFAAEEAQTAAAPGGESLLGSQATREAFVRLAPTAERLHLATHAVDEPLAPLLSRLLFSASAQSDGQLSVRDLGRLKLKADLVVLSSCRSGLHHDIGSLRQVEFNRVGLAEAFLHAGSRSVLATLFPAEDRASLRFMSLFYRYLRIHSPAQALAQAQRDFRNGDWSGSPDERNRYSHPSFWSGYVLKGIP